MGNITVHLLGRASCDVVSVSQQETLAHLFEQRGLSPRYWVISGKNLNDCHLNDCNLNKNVCDLVSKDGELWLMLLEPMMNVNPRCLKWPE
jgi:hypothetical protein